MLNLLIINSIIKLIPIMSQDSIRVKLVVVGDGCVGKTCLLVSYVENRFPKEYTPTIFDNMSTTIKLDNKMFTLGLWDTAGQQEYNRLRPLAYPNSDIILIVFSVVDPDSFLNAKSKWYPELQGTVPKAMKMFVGNKIDLRQQYQHKNLDSKKAPIMKQTARKMQIYGMQRVNASRPQRNLPLGNQVSNEKPIRRKMEFRQVIVHLTYHMSLQSHLKNKSNILLFSLLNSIQLFLIQAILMKPNQTKYPQKQDQYETRIQIFKDFQKSYQLNHKNITFNFDQTFNQKPVQINTQLSQTIHQKITQEEFLLNIQKEVHSFLLHRIKNKNQSSPLRNMSQIIGATSIMLEQAQKYIVNVQKLQNIFNK